MFQQFLLFLEQVIHQEVEVTALGVFSLNTSLIFAVSILTTGIYPVKWIMPVTLMLVVTRKPHSCQPLTHL